MKKTDLKRHLNIYSIFKKRHTTINHAFASAISYFDDYEEKEINKALKLLGQNPNNDLKCVYCNKKAESWDHLFSLIKNGMYTGFGHQLGNLVPCCKKCNSSKGKKDYISFLDFLDIDELTKSNRKLILEKYIDSYKNNVIDIESTKYIEITKDYLDIKNKIFELMKLADEKAEIIRKELKN